MLQIRNFKHILYRITKTFGIKIPNDPIRTLESNHKTMRERPSIMLAKVRHWCRAARERRRHPLHLACVVGDVEGVKALLECTFGMIQDEEAYVKQYMSDSFEDRLNKNEDNEDDEEDENVLTQMLTFPWTLLGLINCCCFAPYQIRTVLLHSTSLLSTDNKISRIYS